MATTFAVATKFTAIDRFSSTVGKMTASLDKMHKKTSKLLDPINNYVNIGFAGAITAAGLAMGKFVTEASKIEDSVAGFTPLLGSVEKANKLVDLLNKTAASTPFEFNDIAKTASTLLPFMNGNLEKTVSIFRMLGDTSKGNAQKLESITRGYSKALGKGKADMESLNMIAEAGVPIMDQLSKMYGVSIAKLYEMSAAGKISASDLTKVFQQMTSKGGIFFKGMDVASQTWSGQMSTLKDNINLAFAAIGTQMLPILKEYQKILIDATGKLQEWVKANQGLIKTRVKEYLEKIVGVLKFIYNNFGLILTIVKWTVIAVVALKIANFALAASIWIVKAATLASNIALGIQIALQGKSAFYVHGNTVAYAAYRVAVVTATAAQWLWNAAMTANPIGLIIVGVAALIGLIVAIVAKWNQWGAAVAVLMGPLYIIISIIQSFRRNWEMVKEAFKTEGILGGLKAIGKVILDALIMPVQQLLKLIAKIPGMAKIMQPAIDKMQGWRESMGVNTTTDESGKPLNPDATTTAVATQRLEKTNNAKVQVEVKASAGTEAKVGSQKDISAKVSNTVGYQR